MERYQQPMVNIMTRRASPQHVTLTCPAGTPQDPIYLTIPLTASSEEHISEVVPKRPKEQEASMFIACSDYRLIIGMKNSTVFYLMRAGVFNGGLTYFVCLSSLRG